MLLALFLVAGVTASLLFVTLAPVLGSQITEESLGERIFNLENGTFVYNLFVYPGVHKDIFIPGSGSVTFQARFGKQFKIEYVPYMDVATVGEIQGNRFDTFKVSFFDMNMKQIGVTNDVKNGVLASIPHPASDAAVGTTDTTWDKFMYVKISNNNPGNRDIKFYVYVPAD